MAEASFDAVVVGAGFAGAAAASVLQQAGLRTVVLEARDRAGGRAFTRTFAASGDLLEFGGSWIAPGHRRIRHYAEKCGFLLRPTASVAGRRWHDGSVLRDDAPAAASDLEQYELGRKRIIADAGLYANEAEGDRASLFSASTPAARCGPRPWRGGAFRAMAIPPKSRRPNFSQAAPMATVLPKE